MGVFNLDQSIGRKPTSLLAQGPIIQPNAAVGSTFMWYDNTFNQDANNMYPTMTLELGSTWFEEDVGGYNIMNAFQYVSLTATTACGQLLTPDPMAFSATQPATGDVVIAAGSSASAVQLTTTQLAANAASGMLLFLENAGTNPQLRVIKQNTANGGSPDRTFYVSMRDPNNTGNTSDADLLPYTPTNASKAFIIAPFQRKICVVGLIPVGVALGATTYTVNPYSVVQVAGVAMIKATASAYTWGLPLKAIAAGAADIGTTTFALNQGQQMTSLYQGTATAGVNYPALVNFLGSI